MPLPNVGGLLGALGNSFSGTNPFMNLAVGLLAQPQYTTTPRGPLEGVGSALQYAGATTSRAQEEALKAQYMRDRMAENQKAAAAQQQFRDLITSGKVAPPTGVSPEAFAAAYAADPDAFGKAYATSIFPQKLDPAAEVEMLKLRVDIDRQRQEAAKAALEVAQGKAGAETKLVGAADAIHTVRGAGNRLVGSSLAPGSATAGYVGPLVKGAAAVESMFPGFGIQEGAESTLGATQADVADRETLTKGVTTLVNTLTPMAQQGSGGSVLGLTLAEKASANINLQWPTIRRILIQNTTQAIREADRLGVEIPNEAGLRKELDAMRAEDEEYTRTGGKIDQSAIDAHTPTDEMVAAEAKKRDLTVGAPGGGGRLTTQPASVRTPLPEEGGDVETPVAPAAAPPAVAPGAFGLPPSFSPGGMFADLFGGAKTVAGDVASQVAPYLQAGTGAVEDAARQAVQKVQTTTLPGIDDVVPPQTQGEIKNAVQQGVADARPTIHAAIRVAREAGDKVAAVGNNIYALGGRKLGSVDPRGILEVTPSDRKLAKEAVRKGYAKAAKIGTKYIFWQD